MLFLGFMTVEQYAAAVKIPDYFEDERYGGVRAWHLANQPRYGNETAWWESAPDGYKEQTIFADATIAAQEAQWDTTNTVQPYLVQTDSKVNIPDYWNDDRYNPTWTWAKANEPRYGDEASWIESSPAGYKGEDIMSADVVAD
jgi:hypothetical protein